MVSDRPPLDNSEYAGGQILNALRNTPTPGGADSTATKGTFKRWRS